MIYDYTVVGGGIVGLATARALAEKYPQAKILLLEKEADWAQHQTGNNSGVMHSGIYYKPGSLKAQMAIAGNRSMKEFCEENDIPHDNCGKVIVATEESELPQLDFLYKRGQEHGMELYKIGPERLAELEPHAKALGALHVPGAAIVDYLEVSRKIAQLLSSQGAEMRLNSEVLSSEMTGGHVRVNIKDADPVETRFLINCCGLQSDRVARKAGADVQMKIIPFRGEYYVLKPEKAYLVKNLIYPVPNLNFPFLGVHYTRKMRGGVECGPNAVLAFRREGYKKSQINLRDLGEVLTYGAFWKLAGQYWKYGAAEMWRSFNKASFVKSLQKMIPEIQSEDLVPGGAGVRAQALGSDGAMLDDFYFLHSEHSLHVCNAPSPAATASLEIGKSIAEEVPAFAEL